jgi:ribosomal protein L24E
LRELQKEPRGVRWVIKREQQIANRSHIDCY